MENREQRLPNKTKYDTWKSNLSMQRLQPGLKALISFSSESKLEDEDLQMRNLRCLTRTNTFPSSNILALPFLSPSSSSSSSSEMGEKGSSDNQEKGKEIEGDEEQEEEEEVVVENMSRRQKWRNEWRKRELPPPMPMVVKTEKNSACQDHVPWMLKKYSYSDNGNDEGGGNRVVIIEEKVKHQEYFRAHRANGHLTLQLICVDEDEEDENVEEDDETPRLETDNAVLEEESFFDVEQEYNETDETEETEDVEDTDLTVEKISVMTLASSMPELSVVSKSNGGGASGKCWTISSSMGKRSNSDVFRMPIPTIRPIYG
ncbi:transcriptional regulator Myc-A-like [Telopea speciosissima]|uniref:transcriptional regulator Myc-A-like n=1 Tax=Telopea speciosissima TaxID=54955 RepID=UPI001CC4E20A|nr:transcriptional regulator Myc-A-like [Telopea speciosissima]